MRDGGPKAFFFVLVVSVSLAVFYLFWVTERGPRRSDEARPPQPVAEPVSGPGPPSATTAFPPPVPLGVPSTPGRSIPSPPPRPTPAAGGAPSLSSEATLMANLRGLVESDPGRALELARDGNRRFGETAEAPERYWAIAKSLVNLQRFQEARDEAKRLVEKYPDDAFALDVQRHLLVYPLGQPSREEMQEQIRREEEQQRQGQH